VAKRVSGRLSAQAVTSLVQRATKKSEARLRSEVTTPKEVHERLTEAKQLSALKDELTFEVAADEHAVEEARQALAEALQSKDPDREERIAAAQAQLASYEEELTADRRANSALGLTIGGLSFTANKHKNFQISVLSDALLAKALQRPDEYAQFINRVEANLRTQLKTPGREINLRLAIALSSNVFRDFLDWDIQLVEKPLQPVRMRLSWLAASYDDLGKAPTEERLRQQAQLGTPPHRAPLTLRELSSWNPAMTVAENVDRAIAATRHADQAWEVLALVHEARKRGYSPRAIYEYTGVITRGFSVDNERRCNLAQQEQAVAELVDLLKTHPLKSCLPSELTKPSEAQLWSLREAYERS
jgi:hypothetical protein